MAGPPRVRPGTKIKASPVAGPSLATRQAEASKWMVAQIQESLAQQLPEVRETMVNVLRQSMRLAGEELHERVREATRAVPVATPQLPRMVHDLTVQVERLNMVLEATIMDSLTPVQRAMYLELRANTVVDPQATRAALNDNLCDEGRPLLGQQVLAGLLPLKVFMGGVTSG